jgi:hypothetical protein
VPAKIEASPTNEAIKAIGTKKRVAALPAKNQPQYVIIYNYFVVFGHLSIRLL